jgi:XTP/dITP diphosphohydrolase
MIYFATGNQNKFDEAKAVLGESLKMVELDLSESQSMDVKEISKEKVLHAYEHTGKPIFVWDEGLYFEALNGFPGSLVKWFWETVGMEKICDMVHGAGNDKVYSLAVLTYHDGNEIHQFSGRIDGRVPKKPRGEKGWGWDQLFIPDGFDKTYAEFEPDEVIPYRSHTKALEEFKGFLNK